MLEPHLEHAVDEFGIVDLDVVGQSEAASERTVGDAVVEVLGRFGIGVTGGIALDDQLAVLKRELDVLLGEAGDRHLDHVLVVVDLLEVERRVRGSRIVGEPLGAFLE